MKLLQPPLLIWSTTPKQTMNELSCQNKDNHKWIVPLKIAFPTWMLYATYQELCLCGNKDSNWNTQILKIIVTQHPFIAYIQYIHERQQLTQVHELVWIRCTPQIVRPGGQDIFSDLLMLSQSKMDTIGRSQSSLAQKSSRRSRHK